MEANNLYNYTPSGQLTLKNYRKIVIWFTVFIVLSIVVIAVSEVFASKRFHVVSTNPSVGSVDTATPFFDITFNKDLSTKNIALTSTDSIVASYAVHEDMLDIKINGPLNVNTVYNITLVHVSDTTGQKITNKVITFNAEYVASQNIPKDQQQAILKNQTNRSPSIADVNFVGTDSLVNNGLTTGQVVQTEQAFFAYQPKATEVVINTASVEPGPHDPNSSNPFSLDFSVAINNTTYNADLSYYGISGIELVLYNPQNSAKLFDSGPLAGSEDQ